VDAHEHPLLKWNIVQFETQQRNFLGPLRAKLKKSPDTEEQLKAKLRKLRAAAVTDPDETEEEELEEMKVEDADDKPQGILCYFSILFFICYLSILCFRVRCGREGGDGGRERQDHGVRERAG
jgi:hypothetical protein